MKIGQNESTIDRVIRIVLGLALVALAVTGVVAAPWTYIVWAVAAIALITGAVGFCPLYAVLRVGTRSAKG
jgi:Inner membrane protein YgaP-like, transmembrane domain